MDRRKFLCGVTITGAAASQAAAPPAAKETASVTWNVQGFTCITCAVGLEVMLKGLKGVARVQAAYPQNTVAIGYDAGQVSGQTLKAFISKCGFRVA